VLYEESISSRITSKLLELLRDGNKHHLAALIPSFGRTIPHDVARRSYLGAKFKTAWARARLEKPGSEDEVLQDARSGRRWMVARRVWNMKKKGLLVAQGVKKNRTVQLTEAGLKLASAKPNPQRKVKKQCQSSRPPSPPTCPPT
jgi:hypothetical protein